MDINPRILLIILVGLAFTEIHTLIPDSDPADYFPFYDPPEPLDWYGITRKTYFHYMGQHIFILCFVAYIIMADNDYRHLFKAFFILEFAYFADYLLIYHKPFLGSIKFSNIRMVLYTYLIVNEIWKRQKSSL